MRKNLLEQECQHNGNLSYPLLHMSD